MKTTPNLTNEFHPVPKPEPKKKKPKHFIGTGKKTQHWENARVVLKKTFEAWGITRCEIKTSECVFDNFLGFAHVDRRRNLTPEDVKSPNKVVLACQPCHHIVDFIMDRKEARELLEKIIENREAQI